MPENLRTRQMNTKILSELEFNNTTRYKFTLVCVCALFSLFVSEVNAASFLTCTVEHIFSRGGALERQEKKILSIKIDTLTSGKSSITVNSDDPLDNEVVYSDTVCFDSKFYSGWLKIWVESGKKGQGCSSSFKSETDYYEGFISEDAGFASSFAVVKSIKINRITGTYNEIENLWVPNSQYDSRLNHQTKGLCVKTDAKF
jgi:hypothetical protein